MIESFFSYIHIEAILQILLAALLGAAIGLEREHWKKDAGLRTYMLICIGSALFAMICVYSTDAYPMMSFQPINAVAIGIGFLGSGLILNKQGHKEGLTTAISAWTASAIGVAVGFKLYFIAFFATVICFIVLRVLRHIEAKYLD
jgi:putative Mg2+ transporter-C (MgtC) family protein